MLFLPRFLSTPLYNISKETPGQKKLIEWRFYMVHQQHLYDHILFSFVSVFTSLLRKLSELFYFFLTFHIWNLIIQWLDRSRQHFIWLGIFLITYLDTAAWNCKIVEFPRSVSFNGYMFRIYIRLTSLNILARVFVYIKSTTSTLVTIIIKNIKCPHRTSQNIKKAIYKRTTEDSLSRKIYILFGCIAGVFNGQWKHASKRRCLLIEKVSENRIMLKWFRSLESEQN